MVMMMAAMTTTATAQKYVGGDISMLTKYEDAGVQYKDKNGVYTTCGIWTFMVQYTEESYNIFTVDFASGTVTWIK